MTNNLKSINNYGPVLSCGAASVSFSHKDDEPTVFDRLFAAVINLFNGGDQRVDRIENAGIGSSDRSPVTSYRMAS